MLNTGCNVCGKDKGSGHKYCEACKLDVIARKKYSVASILYHTRRRNETHKRTWKCIEHLGGKCNRCGKSDVARSSFEFHHLRDKEEMISDLVRRLGKDWWTKTKRELDKCELLCANCHGIEHYSDAAVGYKAMLRRKRIREFIDYLGGCCNYCGEAYHAAAYTFHHRKPATKVANVTDYLRGKQPLANVWGELDKCDLVCDNCHGEHHEALREIGIDYVEFGK